MLIAINFLEVFMKLLTISDVLKMLLIKRTAFYQLRKKGLFPEPINITGGHKGMRWLEEDVKQFILSNRKVYLLDNEEYYKDI